MEDKTNQTNKLIISKMVFKNKKFYTEKKFFIHFLSNKWRERKFSIYMFSIFLLFSKIILFYSTNWEIDLSMSEIAWQNRCKFKKKKSFYA